MVVINNLTEILL